MGIYLPCARTLDCAVWFGAGIACSQGIRPWFLSTTCKCKNALSVAVASSSHTTSPCLSADLHISVHPTYLDECGFFKSLVVRLPYSSIFWWFRVLFVLMSSCNSFCGCVRLWSISTYTSILTRSAGSVETVNCDYVTVRVGILPASQGIFG